MVTVLVSVAPVGVTGLNAPVPPAGRLRTLRRLREKHRGPPVYQVVPLRRFNRLLHTLIIAPGEPLMPSRRILVWAVAPIIAAVIGMACSADSSSATTLNASAQVSTPR